MQPLIFAPILSEKVEYKHTLFEVLYLKCGSSNYSDRNWSFTLKTLETVIFLFYALFQYLLFHTGDNFFSAGCYHQYSSIPPNYNQFFDGMIYIPVHHTHQHNTYRQAHPVFSLFVFQVFKSIQPELIAIFWNVCRLQMALLFVSPNLSGKIRCPLKNTIVVIQ